MTSLVALIDYGSGNLRSAEKALARVAAERGTGQQIVVTADAAVVGKAERIVLPGVGAFADCMAGLSGLSGMVATLNERVIARGVPFLGICVGMQLMASVGREFGYHPGLDWIAGEVVRMTPSDPALKIPQIGWNELAFTRSPSRHGRTAGAGQRLFRPLLRLFLCPRGGRPGADGLWRAGHRGDRARQSHRCAIPSREEPGGRPRPARQFPGLAAMILFPAIDLKDGRCVRLKRGLDGSGDGVQRRSGGAGAAIPGRRLSMAALRRPSMAPSTAGR
ncbi:MAG: imidazole glycerol phosphate synthase subunit HisH [Rhizomicrobium sp.]